MEYNTQQRKLPLPEYGRSVQNMVDYALTIKDREERQRCANTIVNIMGGMFPHLRDVADFKHKLWDHLAIMADFKLDIDYPVVFSGYKINLLFFKDSCIDAEPFAFQLQENKVLQSIPNPVGMPCV